MGLVCADWVTIPHGGLGKDVQIVFQLLIRLEGSPSHAVGLEHYKTKFNSLTFKQSPSHPVGSEPRLCGNGIKSF